MTQEQKITAIENKIRGECEWLMKLSTGCLVSLEANGDRPQVHTVYKATFPKWNDVVPYEIETCCGTWTPTSLNDGKWKHEMQLGGWDTIGHPIHLEDLLYVISKTGGRMGHITIETPDNKKYDIEEYYTDTHVGKILFMYNLSLSFKENLEQSEELTDFLFNLICTK